MIIAIHTRIDMPDSIGKIRAIDPASPVNATIV